MNAPSSCERPKTSLSPSRRGSRFPVNTIAAVAISRPISRAPESPMKSFDGFQLSGRKPMHTPISTTAMNEARLE